MSIFSSIFGRYKSPYLYGISQRNAFPQLDPEDYLDLIFQSSAHALQWREKDLSVSKNRLFVKRGVELARQNGKVFLVNTHVELALEEGADGSHLTSMQELSHAISLRNRYGNRTFLLGKSTHSPEEVLKAAEQGADYVLLGPVQIPLSKRSNRFPLGYSMLARAVQLADIPVFALGGVQEAELACIGQLGAAGVAGITWLRKSITQCLDKGDGGDF